MATRAENPFGEALARATFFVCVAAAAATLACPSTARAASSPPPAIAVHYTAPAACPAADVFRARLLERRMADGSATPRSDRVDVTVTETAGSFDGEVHVAHADGTTTVRRISAPHCDEVTDALELVAAIGLGLDARPIEHPAPAPPPPPAPSPPPARPSLWHFGAALRAALLTSVTPRAAFAPDVALQLSLDTGRVLAPSFELSGTWVTSGALTAPEGTATLTLWAGALTVCPLRVAVGTFSARPCAEVSAGALTGSASGANVTGGALTQPRVAAAPLVRLEWAFSKHVGLEAEGGADFEIVREHFFFRPLGTNVFSSPTAGALARLGVFVRWP